MLPALKKKTLRLLQTVLAFYSASFLSWAGWQEALIACITLSTPPGKMLSANAEVKAKLRLESKQAVHNYFPPPHLFVSLGMREGGEGILALPGDGSLMKVFLGNDLGD